jgi:hypothetical protein
MLFRYENAPNSGLMTLLTARIASKTDRSKQLTAGECAQHVVIAARSC